MSEFDELPAVRLRDFYDRIEGRSKITEVTLSLDSNLLYLMVKMEGGDHYVTSMVVREGAERGLVPRELGSLPDGGEYFVLRPIECHPELRVPDSRVRGFQ